MRPRISIWGSVRPSVGRSVRGPSVVSRFFLNREIDISDNSNKPANLQIWQIWQNLTKSDKSLCNSFLDPYFRRIFVQTNLFSLNFDQNGECSRIYTRIYTRPDEVELVTLNYYASNC